MGNWTILIEGTGSHHNQQPSDANALADACVTLLRKHGQTVEHASFTSGGREILPVTGSMGEIPTPT
jgi:hypothetical protein